MAASPVQPKERGDLKKKPPRSSTACAPCPPRGPLRLRPGKAGAKAPARLNTATKFPFRSERIHENTKATITRRHRARRKSPSRLQPVHELRRLPAAGRAAGGPKTPVARAQRVALHHPAPDQRDVDETAAARGACRHWQRRRRRAGQRLQTAGPRQPHHGGPAPGTCWPP